VWKIKKVLTIFLKIYVSNYKKPSFNKLVFL
jgi:hypothetical protein